MENKKSYKNDDQEDKTCPNCGIRYYGNSCINCGTTNKNSNLSFEENDNDEDEVYDWRERK